MLKVVHCHASLYVSVQQQWLIHCITHFIWTFPQGPSLTLAWMHLLHSYWPTHIIAIKNLLRGNIILACICNDHGETCCWLVFLDIFQKPQANVFKLGTVLYFDSRMNSFDWWSHVNDCNAKILIVCPYFKTLSYLWQFHKIATLF